MEIILRIVLLLSVLAIYYYAIYRISKIKVDSIKITLVVSFLVTIFLSSYITHFDRIYFEGKREKAFVNKVEKNSIYSGRGDVSNLYFYELECNDSIIRGMSSAIWTFNEGDTIDIMILNSTNYFIIGNPNKFITKPLFYGYIIPMFILNIVPFIFLFYIINIRYDRMRDFFNIVKMDLIIPNKGNLLKMIYSLRVVLPLLLVVAYITYFLFSSLVQSFNRHFIWTGTIFCLIFIYFYFVAPFFLDIILKIKLGKVKPYDKINMAISIIASLLTSYLILDALIILTYMPSGTSRLFLILDTILKVLK